MKHILLVIGVLNLCSFTCFGKTIEERGNAVIYKTLDDLSRDNRRLAETVLTVEKRFPAKGKYVIEFNKQGYKYVITYEPRQEKLTKQVYRSLRFREDYSKRETRLDQLIRRSIYIGNVRQRLLWTRDGRIRDFVFDDDVVNEEGVTISYEVPAAEEDG